MTSQDDISRSDDRTRYRVAVVVLADIRGVDYNDAASGAAMAIRHALAGDGRGRLPVEHPVPTLRNIEGLDANARVVDVMDLGMAAGNGYLWIEPTRKGWAYRDLDRPDIARRAWLAPADEPEGSAW